MRTAIALAASLLLTAGSAQAYVAQTPGSRIRVDVCHPHVHTAAQAHPWIDPYGLYHARLGGFPAFDAFLEIDYANLAPVAATEVDFGLVARGSLIALAKDVGTFSPQVAIAHEFVVSREIFPIGTAIPVCAVLRVRYADGTVWTNPDPPRP